MSKKVLVVDDDAQIREALAKCHQQLKHGYTTPYPCGNQPETVQTSEQLAKTCLELHHPCK